MGREKTLLLGFLGLLAGVFVGVLSLKLLVPRPPTGAGPDIRTEAALTTPQERVAPPAPGGWDFTAAPPLAPDVPAADVAPLRFSRFASPAATPAEAVDVATSRGTTAVEPVPLEPPADVPPPATSDPGPPLRDPFVVPATATRAVPVAGDYLVQAGDSWWSVAERAYGDGHLYRALFAWNRSRDPRVTLAPGTRLDVPPLDRLRTAWPRLMSPAAPR